jgi:hypothetical protein
MVLVSPVPLLLLFAMLESVPIVVAIAAILRESRPRHGRKSQDSGEDDGGLVSHHGAYGSATRLRMTCDGGAPPRGSLARFWGRLMALPAPPAVPRTPPRRP